MATVYLADDIKHERKVALKVLKPELAAVVGAERFLAEIKTTANLQHPHILPLFPAHRERCLEDQTDNHRRHAEICKAPDPVAEVPTQVEQVVAADRDTDRERHQDCRGPQVRSDSRWRADALSNQK